MAIPLRQLVDVLAVMKDSSYDQALIVFALLGPLAMFALSSWRASLETWYTPMDRVDASYFGAPFERKLSNWLAGSEHAGPELVVITDRGCPCTAASLDRLNEALKQSPLKKIRVIVRDIHDAQANADASWKQLLEELPATPSLLALNSRQLVYAGPVSSGSFCTTAAGRVWGVMALQSPRRIPIINVIDKGCYCRLPGI